MSIISMILEDIQFLLHKTLLPIRKLTREERNPPPVSPIITFGGEQTLCSWSNFYSVIWRGGLRFPH